MPRLALLLPLLLAGCVSTQSVSLDTAEGRARINERAERGHPVLTLTGQRGHLVQALHIAPDLTTWIDRKTGEARAAPTSSVEAVTFRRDGAGALKGLAVGASTGAALGLLIGLAEDDPGFFSLSTGGWTAVAAAQGALVGTLAGALHSDRAVFVNGPAEPLGARSGAEACGGPPLACAAPRLTVARR